MTTTSPKNELDRVRKHTAAHTLKEIEQQIEDSIYFYSSQSHSALNARIKELEREWSMERWLETNASALAFTGVALGLMKSKKWLALPLIVTAFLFQHAVQGWCPPIPVLRKLGVRTRSEIDREKVALKVLRGDFKGVNGGVARKPTQFKRILATVNA
jgi:hypothetical protein